MFNGAFLSQFDAFAKPLKDFRVKTVTGAIVSIFSCLSIFFLFNSELFLYLTPHIKQEIMVDVNRGAKMSIDLDITYLEIPCIMLNLDTMDATGEEQIDVHHEIYKTPVDTHGAILSPSIRHEVNRATAVVPEEQNKTDECGSCYGAESETRNCCNTCKDVQQAYYEKNWVVTNMSMFQQCQKENWINEVSKLGKEGCRIHGQLQVNKVAGSFHISPGNSYAVNHVHVHHLQNIGTAKLNMSHKITKLSFGGTYPGQVNPLDGTTVNVVEPSQMFSYYLKLVPTLYLKFDPEQQKEVMLETNQYSVTWYMRGTPLSGDSHGIPGLFFNYEISPILVRISEEKRSLLHFLTNTCAIIGGVFTVASLVDGFIYRSTCALRSRMKSSRF